MSCLACSSICMANSLVGVNIKASGSLRSVVCVCWHTVLYICNIVGIRNEAAKIKETENRVIIEYYTFIPYLQTY